MIKAKLQMLELITAKFDEMKVFYRDVLGMEVVSESNTYVEFKHPGIRFAIATSEVRSQITGHASYKEAKRGQSFELAFAVDSPAEVDGTYNEILKQGATAVSPPADMPWGHRTAFFADPDGNIHDIFADLPQ